MVALKTPDIWGKSHDKWMKDYIKQVIDRDDIPFY